MHSINLGRSKTDHLAVVKMLYLATVLVHRRDIMANGNLSDVCMLRCFLSAFNQMQYVLSALLDIILPSEFSEVQHCHSW